MKPIRFYHYITLLFVFIIISCKNEMSLEKAYDQYKESFNKSSFEENENIVSFKDYYREISQEEKIYILKLEINSLKESEISGIGKSDPAIFQDSKGIRQRYCGTSDKSDRTTPKSYKNNNVSYARIFRRERRIPLIFHIVGEKNNSFNIDENLIAQQVNLLNEAFSKIQVVFYVKEIKKYVNSKWYEAYADSDGYDKMVDNIITLPIKEINIISTNQDSLLGRAIFPWDDLIGTKSDHILLNENTFPGKNLGNEFFSGKTLIHEMGHYFGLFHTFHMEQYDESGNKVYHNCDDLTHNGCSEDMEDKYKGDLVDDTPAQKICHFFKCKHCGDNDCSGCDTCPDLLGKDPVKNYMGYNPDSCMDHFTDGQYNRMETWLYTRRNIFLHELQ